MVRRLRQLIRKPSPSMIVALTALVVALGGTAYSAINLPRNSVGRKQIRRGAVTTAKIKDRTIRRVDVDLNRLGPVPVALFADAAKPVSAAGGALTGSYPDPGLAQPEQWHIVRASGEPPSGEPSLGSNWEPVSSAATRPGFYKDPFGIVHLKGYVVGATGGDVIFTLPAGYRPAHYVIESVARGTGTGTGQLLICGPAGCPSAGAQNGDVIAPTGAEVSLDGVTFRVGE